MLCSYYPCEWSPVSIWAYLPLPCSGSPLCCCCPDGPFFFFFQWSLKLFCLLFVPLLLTQLFLTLCFTYYHLFPFSNIRLKVHYRKWDFNIKYDSICGATKYPVSSLVTAQISLAYYHMTFSWTLPNIFFLFCFCL